MGGGQFALWLSFGFSLKSLSLPIMHLISGTGSGLGSPFAIHAPSPYRDRRPEVGGGRSTLLWGSGDGMGTLNYSLK